MKTKIIISIIVLILFILIVIFTPREGNANSLNQAYPPPPTQGAPTSWEMYCDGNVTQSFYAYNSNNQPIWKVSCYPYDQSTVVPTFTPLPTWTFTPQPTATNTPLPTNTPTRTNTPLPTNTAVPTNTQVPITGLVINHNSVELFDRIPQQYLNLAFQTRFYFVDQSVGSNIYEGINCMNVPYANALNHCKRWNHTGIPSYSVDPSVLYWNGSYSSNNVAYQFWDNIGVNCTNSLEQMFGCFLNRAEQVKSQYDILSFQVSYLQVDGSNSWIMNFFQNVNQLEQWQANNPDKLLIYWTTSLSRGIGTPISEQFNNQMRQYAIQNNKVLFDVADILSHDPNGNPCYDNRDGVAYTFGTKSENYPDDGLNIPAICPHYTTEVDGGHLGSASAGKIRIAKAFWVMLAQINGWRP